MISVKLLYRSPMKDDRSTSDAVDENTTGASVIILNDRNCGPVDPSKEETQDHWFGNMDVRDAEL